MNRILFAMSDKFLLALTHDAEPCTFAEQGVPHTGVSRTSPRVQLLAKLNSRELTAIPHAKQYAFEGPQ